MTLRHTSGIRRNVLSFTAVIVATFALAACGGGGGDSSDGGNSEGKPKSSENSEEGERGGPGKVDTGKTIGKLKGPNGIEIAVHSATRNSGGFVTISGTLHNKGEGTFRAIEWQSGETAIKSKSSIAGATMVDSSGKKRYLVLRDTDGQCLCSTGLSGVKGGESRPVFAQFPAPPDDVKTVEFHVPSMSPAQLQLSEG